MNHHASLSFILGGEILSRTNTQNYKETITDISTPCWINVSCTSLNVNVAWGYYVRAMRAMVNGD